MTKTASNTFIVSIFIAASHIVAYFINLTS